MPHAMLCLLTEIPSPAYPHVFELMSHLTQGLTSLFHSKLLGFTGHSAHSRFRGANTEEQSVCSALRVF